MAIVGAGVVGCAIARRLAHHPGLRVALVEAQDDVGQGTSKANTAILHTGFDAVPGSLEARLVREGSRELAAYAAESGIPVERVGALLVAWDEEQLAALPRLAEKARRNEYHDTRVLGAADLYAREPRLGPGALGALHVPGESIICSWTTTLAYATQAVRAGVDLYLEAPITHAGHADGVHRLDTPRGPLHARRLVNAAGLHADTLDRSLGHDDFTVTPRRGQLVVHDTFARALVRHILLPVPTALGKGVLVAPTVYGNVLLGPTAEDLDDKGDTGSTAEGLRRLREQGRRILPALLEEEVTAVYAGLRAATGHDDYRIAAHPGQGYVTVGGIRSTGLTASSPSPRTSPASSRTPASTSAPGARSNRSACRTSARPSPSPPAPRPGGRRPGVRHPGLPLRTRLPRRDPRRPRRAGPTPVPGRTAPPHPGPGGPLPGLLLRGGGTGVVRGGARVTSRQADVLVVGAGPAGLTAAARLARTGARVVLLEREQSPGESPGTARTAASATGRTP